MKPATNQMWTANADVNSALLQAREARAADRFVAVCSWCAPRELRQLDNSTHGICPTCIPIMRREIELHYFNLGRGVTAGETAHRGLGSSGGSRHGSGVSAFSEAAAGGSAA